MGNVPATYIYMYVCDCIRAYVCVSMRARERLYVCVCVDKDHANVSGIRTKVLPQEGYKAGNNHPWKFSAIRKKKLTSFESSFCARYDSMSYVFPG